VLLSTTGGEAREASPLATFYGVPLFVGTEDDVD
jgi:hypothetical protein